MIRRMLPVIDQLSRPLSDLRISVTDRCNFRCSYCMPKEVFGPGFQFLRRHELLTYEEIATLARAFVAAGVRKIRITGGEPLLRRDLPLLIEQLAVIPELADLTLTTNGTLLAQLAPSLRRAGLKRVTVSLDSLDEAVFARMNDVGIRPSVVLSGIEAAAAAGLAPIKINAVVQRGVNDHTLVELARFFHGSGHIVRFIEFMDVGTTNGWQLEKVVSGREIAEIIHREMPIAPVEPNYPGEVAARWSYLDGGGEIGIITSVSQPFCGGCTRARLSSEGKLFTCLFAADGHDLRALVRSGATEEQLHGEIRRLWQGRTDRYSEIRSAATVGGAKVEMSHIGG